VATTRAWLRRHLRLVAGLLALGLLGVGAAIAATWHFSSVVVVPDHSSWPVNTTVDAVEPRQIVLDRNEESARPGVYGIDWQAGHAIGGPILEQDDETVTRRLSDVRGYLMAGMKVALDSHVYAGDPTQALGLPYRSIAIPDRLGPMPAWEIPAAPASPHRADRIWTILVHGHNDSPVNDLRVAPKLRKLGFTSLAISYRNDLGAPESPDGLYHLGETEWMDLAAAVHYALDHGARRVVLFGWSMGGALVEQFMLRSSLAGRVAALVLDAPVLDWRSVIEFNSEELGLPSFLAWPVEWAVDARVNPDWDSLDALQHTGSFQLPVLLFHSTDDERVPIADSEAFAAALPSWVTFYRVPDVGHTENWNANPELYERRLGSFLGPLFTGKGAPTKEARPQRSGFK
jgi:alpha-beta hydrolase superfamily lysophospholipase